MTKREKQKMNLISEKNREIQALIESLSEILPLAERHAKSIEDLEEKHQAFSKWYNAYKILEMFKP